MFTMGLFLLWCHFEMDSANFRNRRQRDSGRIGDKSSGGDSRMMREEHGMVFKGHDFVIPHIKWYT